MMVEVSGGGIISPRSAQPIVKEKIDKSIRAKHLPRNAIFCCRHFSLAKPIISRHSGP